MDTRHRIDLLEPLVLADLTPVAIGKERLVFVHPSAPGLIVKVVRPDRRQARDQASRRWLHSRARLRHYTLMLREFREYLALRALMPGGELPLARLVGLVETDLGLGLVSERVEFPVGTLAPTLVQMLSAGHDRQQLHFAIDQLCESLLRFNVVVNDLNASNLVACNTSDGSLRFLLVDGFGEKTLLPLRSLIRSFNRYKTRKYVALLHALVTRSPPGQEVLTGMQA